MNRLQRLVYSLTGKGGPAVAAPAGTKSRAYVGGMYPAVWTNGKRQIIPNLAVDYRKTVDQYSRTQLMTLARWLTANFGAVRGMILDKSRYAIGAGFIAQSQADDGDIRKEYEEYFREWSKIADYYGRFTLGQLARLASIAIDQDGDQGFNMTATPTGWPTLQPIPGHSIGGSDDRCYDGIVVDGYGRPIKYRVKLNDDETKDVPAKDFIHLFDPHRCDQGRGVTALAHAVSNLQDAREILDAETMAVKALGELAIIVRNESGSPDDSAAAALTQSDPTNRPNFWEEQSEGAGQTRYIRTDGSEVKAFEHNRPSPTFAGFLDYLIRDAAVGLGLTYEFAWNPERLGGTSQRFILQKAQRSFDERADLMEARFYNRVWGWVISKGIQRGDISPSSDWWKVRWQRPSKITVDVGREAAQNRADLLIGTRTEREDAAERGGDDDDIAETVKQEAIRRIKNAQEVAEETGVSFEVALAQIRNPNGNTAQAATPLSTEPAP